MIMRNIDDLIDATFLLLISECLLNDLNNDDFVEANSDDLNIDVVYIIERLYQKLWKNNITRKMINKHFSNNFYKSDRLFTFYVRKVGIDMDMIEINMRKEGSKGTIIRRVRSVLRIERLSQGRNRHHYTYDEIKKILTEIITNIRKNYFEDAHVIENNVEYEFEKVKFD